MLKRRTDLALEARELWSESAEAETQLEGVRAREEEREGYPVTRVEILNEAGVQALGKPQGTYITLDLSALARREEDAFPRAARALAGELSGLLKLPQGAPALVVGLGNRAITPAAVGTTGGESGELVRAVTERIHPACVIAVDALASRSLKRVCTAVQLADTGIVPGSGVGNHRAALNRETLGVPVIAIGVPTVVDGATLAADILEEAGKGELDPAALAGEGGSLMVTPRDIDQRVSDMAKVIGFGINLALQSGLTVEDVELFLS